MADLVRRLPLHRAPFYFGPQFLATDSEWQYHFERLARDVGEHQEIAIETIGRYGDNALLVRWSDIWLTIDAQYGTLDVRQDDGLDTDYMEAPLVWAGFKDIPDRFVKRLSNSSPTSVDLNDCPETVRRQVLRFARGIQDRMERSFALALASGLCRHEARFKLDDPDIRTVSADHLDYYDVDPWNFDEATPNALNTAVSKDRTSRLYSLCVVPSTAAKVPVQTSLDNPKTSIKGKVDGRLKHQNWSRIEAIIQEEYQKMRLNPNRKKKHLREAVELRFGERGPKKTSLDARINKLFPDF